VLESRQVTERPSRILIIDDEEAARYGIARALANQGYEIEEAANGEAGWTRIGEFHPDVIVSDINMPGLDGISLLRRINQDPQPPLVVLVTAYGSEGVAAEALRAGAHNYLAKPFEVEALRAMVRNAIEKQRLARELRESQAELVQSEKMGSLGRLVAGISHEINTPLGVLQSGSQTMALAAEKIREWSAAQSGGEAEKLGRFVEAILTTAQLSQSACERISAIIGNLKQFARLDEAEYQRVNLHDGILSTLALVKSELGGGIEVVKEFGEIPEIECSPRQLNQLVMNLLLNAMEAIRQNGGKGRIRVRTVPASDEVQIVVEDNGCGIAPEHLEKIFDPGFTTKGVKVGTGLGLPISYQIVEAHGGRIDVASQPGEGATFTVTLPVRRPDAE
jgi:two-component system NtrC family sensor kinase